MACDTTAELSDTATSQGTLRVSGKCQKPGGVTERFFPRDCRGSRALPTPWVWIPSLQNCQRLNSIVLTHPVCGHFLWQPRKLICLMRASVSEKPHCDLFWVIFPSLDMTWPRLGAVVLGLTQVMWLALWWETHIPGSGGGKEGIGTDRKTESSTVIVIYFFTISHWKFWRSQWECCFTKHFYKCFTKKRKMQNSSRLNKSTIFCTVFGTLSRKFSIL